MIFYLKNLKKKIDSRKIQKSNPFIAPFEPGIFIMDLKYGNKLLFNKYAVVKKHLLVVT